MLFHRTKIKSHQAEPIEIAADLLENNTPPLPDEADQQPEIVLPGTITMSYRGRPLTEIPYRLPHKPE